MNSLDFGSEFSVVLEVLLRPVLFVGMNAIA